MPPNIKDSPKEWPVVSVPKCLSSGLNKSWESRRIGHVNAVSSFLVGGPSMSSDDELTTLPLISLTSTVVACYLNGSGIAVVNFLVKDLFLRLFGEVGFFGEDGFFGEFAFFS